MIPDAGAGEKEAAVVFVHGLFSSAQTWSGLVARIAADAELGAHFDVFRMEYPSPKVRSNPLTAIPDYDTIADFMSTYLDVQVAGYRKVVLVSHSQGGLIVQRYLAKSIRRGYARRLRRIRAVIMLACPNSGSDFALVLRRLAKFWKHPQEAQLRPIDKDVAEAQQVVLEHIQYAKTVDAQNCPIPIHLYAGMEDNVVKPASASGMFPEVKALPGDHFTIIEAKSPDSLVFLALRSHLREVLGSVVDADPDAPGTSDTVAVRPDSGPAPRGAEAVRHNLTAPGVFFDRERELRHALAGLASSNPVVSISGLGGMGKSALANRIGRALVNAETGSAQRYFDLVVWSDQGMGGRPLDALIDSISDVLDYRYLRALAMPDKLNRAIEHVNSVKCLIIIDNFDEPRDRAIREFVARIDPATSKVLITSRFRYSRDAWPVDVGGLNDQARTDLALEEGRRLGIEAITAAQDTLIREYLDATGGNPLAIRLTAGQMRYGGDDLRAAITRLRTAADRDIFPAIFDRSWHDLLSADESARTIIMAVALHPVTASREAIAFVLGARVEDQRRAIAEIVETSLVDMFHAAPGAPGRLRLHPLTRAYALHQLQEAPERKARIETRLIDYYRRFATTHRDIYLDPDRVRLLESERDNILAFAQLAFERAGGVRADCLDVIEFAESMAGFLWGRGYWRDRIRLCENAAIAARVAGEPVARARQFALIGRAHAWLGRYADARRCLALSEEALPVSATDAQRRETLRLRGHIATRTGDYVAARALFERILTTAPHTADDEGRAATLVELGVCAVQEGEFLDARARFEEALELDEQMGAIEGAAVSLSHLANTYYQLGDNAGAGPLFARGVELADRVDRPATSGRCHLGLAKISVLERDHPRAEQHARAAAAVFARLGMAEMTAEAELIAGNLGAAVDPRASISGLLRHCRAVILDFDDTLSATALSRWPVLRRTAARFGVDLEVDTIRAAWGLRFDELIAALVPTLDPDEFVAAYRIGMAAEKPIPTPGAIQLVAALQRRRLPRMIVGSGKHELIVQDLRTLGIARYFADDDIFGQEQTGAHKPDPAVLRQPLRRLADRGIAPAEIVSIGDSVRDMQAAWGNDVPFIGVLTGVESRSEFHRAGLPAQLVAADLSLLRLWL